MSMGAPTRYVRPGLEPRLRELQLVVQLAVRRRGIVGGEVRVGKAVRDQRRLHVQAVSRGTPARVAGVARLIPVSHGAEIELSLPACLNIKSVLT